MDVILDKAESIRRCIARIQEEHQGRDENLADQTRQDAVVLNLQRACEQSIDLANHIIAGRKWEIPKTSRDAFDVLHSHRVIDQKTADKLKKMVGFRNIAIHNYQELKVEIVAAVVRDHLSDFTGYLEQVVRYGRGEGKT